MSGRVGQMTGAECREIRLSLGLSLHGAARLLHVADGRTVQRWEVQERDVPGPAEVLLRAIYDSRSVRRYFGLEIEGDHSELDAP